MKKENEKITTKAGTNLISNIQSLTSNNHRGITLVALIITIIVMLILVGVSITIALKGGLFETTKKAAKETENAKNAEQELASGRVKIDGVWYDSIEDYAIGKKSDNQPPEEEKPPVTPPEEPAVKPQVGDYVLYEPDTVSTPYSLAGTQSGKGTYSSSTTPYTFSTPENQDISQENIQWQVLKVHDDGSLDLIGTPTTSTVGFGGWLGYNNGVYLLNDICKELYSKPSKGIYARSVNIEDFEDNDNGGSWKSARNAYTGGIGYNNTKTYTDANYRWYPNLYAQENGSGINTTTVKTNGIKETNPYYTTPTTDTYSQANSTGLTITQTYYNIEINEANYGVTAKVLSQTNAFWLASRAVIGNSSYAIFGLRIADTYLYYSNTFYSYGYANSNAYALRPVVSLGSSVQLSLKTEGMSGEPNTLEIVKY